jgi:hypothetical protein
MCFVKDRYWVVSDRLVAKGEHKYSQLFHFEPGRTAETVGQGRARTTDEDHPNMLVVQADPVAVQILEGQEDPVPRGWQAPGGFKKQPAPVAIFEQTSMDRAHFDTVLYPVDVGRAASVHVERLPVRDTAGGAIVAAKVRALRIDTDEGTDYYINDLRQREIGPANKRVKIAGPVETDARAAVVGLDPHGQLLKASAVGASFIKLHAETIRRP